MVADIEHALSGPLEQVYSVELFGVLASLGLEEDDQSCALGDRLYPPKGSQTVGPAAGPTSPVGSPKCRRRKCRPDLVEAAIGEAFEASLLKTGFNENPPCEIAGGQR